MLIYRENYTLKTNIIGFDIEATHGWTPDCSNKQDYDPNIVCGSSRVYPDGDYGCTISIGETAIIETGILSAESVDAAKAACVAWMDEKAAIVRAAVIAALQI